MSKLKKDRAALLLTILFFLWAGILLFLQFQEKDVLTIGIFYGSNWDVPGTEQYDIFNAAIEKFEKAHPGVRVDYVEGITAEDYSQWLSGEIMKGTAPDVFLVLEEDFDTLVSTGALKSLDWKLERDKEAELSVFYDAAVQAGKYKNEQYALPFECNPTLMFVNKTLLKKEGIRLPDENWTWEDFYDICKKATKDSDGDGKIDLFGCCDYTWLHAANANGIQPFDTGGTQSHFTDSRFMDAVTFVRRLQDLNENYRVTSEDFDLGHVVFRPLTFSDYRTYMPYPWRIKKYSDFEWNCVQMPAGPSGGNVSGMETLMAGISARTKKEEAAWEFLKLLTMDESIQKMIYEYTSGASPLQAVTTSEEVLNLLNKDTPGGSDIDLSLLDKTMKTAVIPAHFTNYKEAVEKADSEIMSLVFSGDDISTAMFRLQKEVDEILRR